MEVVCSSETWVNMDETTRSCIPENSTLHSDCCVNLISGTRVYLRTIEGLLAVI
jgi:hypothetical protein